MDFIQLITMTNVKYDKETLGKYYVYDKSVCKIIIIKAVVYDY